MSTRERQRDGGADNRQGADRDARKRKRFRLGIPVFPRQGVGQRYAARAKQLQPCENRPAHTLADRALLRAHSSERRAQRRQLRRRRLTPVSVILVDETRSENDDSKQQRRRAENRIAAADERGEYGYISDPTHIFVDIPHRRAAAGIRAPAQPRGDLARQSENDERQKKRVHVPSHKQRRASLDQQLAKAPVLDEYDHAVKGHHHAENIHRGLVGNFVAVIERVVGREGDERGG